MNNKIRNFLNDKFGDKVKFVGDVHQNGEKIYFNVQIRDAEIEIPESIQILNIDVSFHLSTYIKMQINKNLLIEY
jgi:hypothetical protein